MLQAGGRPDALRLRGIGCGSVWGPWARPGGRTASMTHGVLRLQVLQDDPQHKAQQSGRAGQQRASAGARSGEHPRRHARRHHRL